MYHIIIYRDLLGDCSEGGSWLDCIKEDESYLRKNRFYSTCTTFSSNVINGNDKCFNNRDQPVDPDNSLASDDPFATFYPGYGTSKCSNQKYDASKTNSESNHQTRHPDYLQWTEMVNSSYMLERSAHYEVAEPLFMQQVSNCRILRTNRGDLRKRCDRIVETRPLYYQAAITLFPPGADLTQDENDFDLFEF